MRDKRIAELTQAVQLLRAHIQASPAADLAAENEQLKLANHKLQVQVRAAQQAAVLGPQLNPPVAVADSRIGGALMLSAGWG